MNNELQNNYDALRRLHNSANEAIIRLEKRLRELEAENGVLRANVENADKRVEIQRQVVIDNLQQSQEVHDKLVKEIMILKEMLKEAREK